MFVNLKATAVFAAVGAVAVLTGCAGGPATNGDDGSEGAATLSKSELRIALGPDPAFAPIAYAIEKGWFEEAGFTAVETQQFVAGVEAGQALVSGEIDLWQPASVPAISLINTGAPVSIVGQGSKCRVESLLVRPDSGVENPEDLYEVEIAVLQGSSLNAYLANLANHYGLDYSRLNIVNMAPAESLTALLNGDIDAAVTFPPSTNRAIVDAGAIEVAGRVSGFEVDSGEEVDFSQTRCVLVMNDGFTSSHPDAAEAAMSVIARAQEYVNDPAHLEEVQQVYADFSDQDLEAVKAAWVSYQFPPEIDDGFETDLKAYSDFLVETGAISGTALPVSDLLNLDAYNAVK